MSNFRKLIFLSGVLCVAILACNRPAQIAPQSAAQSAPAETAPATALPVSGSTSTPLPTAPATPVPLAHITSADQAFFNGEWERAIQEYQSALAQNVDPDIQAAALLGIGRTQYQMGDSSAALDSLRQLVANYPAFPHLAEAYFHLARLYQNLHRFGEAAGAYQSYLELRPGLIDSYAQEWRGDALTTAGDYAAAIAAYQAAMAADRLGDTIPLETKIGAAYAALGDYDTALIIYQDIYTRTTNDYTKAMMDYAIGRAYLSFGETEKAQRAYLDAVQNYPLAYDSYLALIELVDAGYPVSEFDRGVVDYFAGQYSLAIAAFDRHLADSTEQAGAALYYKGMAYQMLAAPQPAIQAWQTLIRSFPEDDFVDEAWEQLGYTQWAYLDQYDAAVQTFLDYVDEYPWQARAPEFLFFAGQVAERSGDLERAATLWQRLPPEYPASPLVPRALFLAGISSYRLGDFPRARQLFEQTLGSSADLADKAAAHFWIGKTQQAQGDEAAAAAAWQKAANTDPTGYYSERARDLLQGRAPFDPPLMFDLGIDWPAERAEAEAWLRQTFAIPDDLDLSALGALASDPRLIRGAELWRLGLYEEARAEFEDLRGAILTSPADNYRLANYLLALGLYRPAIFAARQVLNLNHMDDAATLNAPDYFNHVRFGAYYSDLILPIAEAYGFHPLFLFSVVRQESLFEGFVRSEAGARGLMQIMPETGESIAANAGWPPAYSADDLYRPRVSLTLGADYLANQRNYFGGNLMVALAAYNGGPGNASVWWELAGGDVDLFVELIRYEETRNYVKGIYEIFAIYRRLYDRTP